MRVINSEYKILIIDRSKENLIFLENILKAENFQVIKTQLGAEAIELIKREEPDLVISDILMPDISGFDICSCIRSKSTTQKIPVIFLTTQDDSNSVIEGFRVGANDYITKPFNSNVLVVRIRHQLSLLVAKRTIIKNNLELRDTILSRDKLYSVIAHDLRSPIATIKMITNFLSSSYGEKIDEPTQNKMIQDINFIAEDMFTLLDNLLKWTKSQTGKLIPVFQNIDLVEITRGSVELFSKIASIKNIEVELNSIQVAKADVDIEMIKCCVRNLMSNAYKFSYDNSKIVISVEEEQAYFKIGIQDFGCGMDSESAKKLLDVKTHFSTAGTAHEQGSGLGLLLIQEMIEKNGGKLWFESTLGSGSTFFISIPKVQQERQKHILKKL